MYFTIERLAAERVADFRREADRSRPGGPRHLPPLVRFLLRTFRAGTAMVGSVGFGRLRLTDPLR
jgi:hypothetical protein